MARANGYDSFIDYGNCKNGRIGYGHRELTSFVQEVQQHIVPLYLRLQEEQRKRLGVDVLYPYDTTVLFADGNAKHVDGEEALRQAGYAMYHALSPEAGAFFDEMVAHEMIDVAYSDKKIYGMGFAEYIVGAWKMPFVFSNSNGTTADVTVYTHELGHAF